MTTTRNDPSSPPSPASPGPPPASPFSPSSHLPEELGDLVGRDVLDRIRQAIAALEARGERPTGRAVREIAKIDANKVDRVLRCWKTRRMPPLAETWERAAEKGEVTSELEAEIVAADDVSKLEAVGRQVTVAIMRGKLDPRVGDLVLRGLKEQRQAMRMRMLEQQAASVASIEILTPDELALLQAHRAAQRPQPLEPGVEVAAP